MAKTLEFFFDFGSPASYLAYTQVPKLAASCGASLKWRPMLLGGVFKATGNGSPANVPAKGRWMFEDLSRWAGRYGVVFVQNPYFPINTLTTAWISCVKHSWRKRYDNDTQPRSAPDRATGRHARDQTVSDRHPRLAGA